MNNWSARIVAGVSATAIAVGIAGVASPALAASGDNPEPDPRTGPVYNSMQANPPASHPSYGFTARSTHELGDVIELGGIAREIESVTIGMNSWACETGGGATCVTTPGSTFEEPITVHFYEVGAEGAVGDQIAEFTRTFDIPFRPSASAENCGDSRWYNVDKATCQNGMTVPVTFDLTADDVVLPDEVLVSVTYPTSRFGELPSGPWDSLNVDLVNYVPSVGSDADTSVVYINSEWTGAYGNDGGDTSVFRATNVYAASGYGLNLTIEAKPTTEPVEMYTAYGDFEDGESIVNGLEVAHLGDMLASAGCWYGIAPQTNYSTHGSEGFISTRYSGYANTFPEGGYTTSADFYLDADASEGQFTWSHAVNNTNGNHRRDFVFVAGSDGDGTWTLGASTGVNPSGPTTYGADPATVTASGWYTFEHTLYAGDDNLLYVDLTVLDADGDIVDTWTLGGEAGDLVPGVVGGNRYGWLVTNSFDGLPIDNVVLGEERPTAGCAPFLDVSPEAGPTYSSHAAPIAWMGVTGLSNGWSTVGGSVYRPAAATDRDAMAAFFWRWAGEPEPESTKSPFVDVSTNPASKNYNKHWKAILWMYEEGYANGWSTASGKKFGPHASIRRDAVAAFMYRMYGSPSVSPASGAFVDVSSNPASPVYSKFAKEIQWLHSVGLANGWNTKSGAEYRPTSTIKRDAIAAFIYRANFLDS